MRNTKTICSTTDVTHAMQFGYSIAISFAVALILSLTMTNAQARDIASQMSSIYFNNTSAQSFTTADRTGFTGGGSYIRVPIVNANLISFDPPRLNAGCGGIDFYGGSFSFISGAQLENLLRSVGNSAGALAFKMAISQTFPQLAGAIEELFNKINQMNQLLKNSCSIAHLITDPLKSAFAENTDGAGQKGSVDSSSSSDGFASWLNFTNSPATADKNASAYNAQAGNVVWKAIVSSGAGASLEAIGSAPADDQASPNTPNNQLLASIMGFSVAGTPCSSSSAAGTDASNDPQGKRACVFPATIRARDLMAGPQGADNLYLYSCNDPTGSTGSVPGALDNQICTKISKNTWGSFQSVRSFVNQNLFGTTSDVITDSDFNGGIVGLFVSGNGGTLTAGQKAFLAQAKVPLTAMLAKASDRNAKVLLAKLLRGNIEACVMSSFGTAIAKAMRQSQQASYTFSQNSLEAMAQFERDVATHTQKCESADNIVQAMQVLNYTSNISSVVGR